MSDTKKEWYIINTYVGHEDKVCESLKQRAESLDLADKIFTTLVPKEKQISVKNGKKKVSDVRIFPGYVFVQCIMSDDVWFAIRNTPGVTGFAGATTIGSPQPISQEEVDNLIKRGEKDNVEHKIDFQIGEVVTINDGPFQGIDATVNEVDNQSGKLKVMVNLFGRETSLNIDALQVTKL